MGRLLTVRTAFLTCARVDAPAQVRSDARRSGFRWALAQAFRLNSRDRRKEPVHMHCPEEDDPGKAEQNQRHALQKCRDCVTYMQSSPVDAGYRPAETSLRQSEGTAGPRVARPVASAPALDPDR